MGQISNWKITNYKTGEIAETIEPIPLLQFLKECAMNDSKMIDCKIERIR